MTISRAVGAAALSVAFAAVVSAPALATTLTSDQPRALVRQSPPPASPPAPGSGSVCSTYSSQLVNGVTSIGKDLKAVPPNTADLTGLIEQVLADVTTLQKSGCLPNVPSTPAPPLSAACVPDVAKLLADVFGLVGDLSSMPPNVPDALKSGTGLVSDVSGLIAAKCLSDAKSPAPPVLPGPPATPVPLPKPTLPVSAPTPPSPPKVPGPPSAPKLPGVPAAPATLGLPLPPPTPSVSVPAPTLPLPVPKLPVPTPSVSVPAPKLPLPVPSIPVPTPSVPALPSPPKLPLPLPSLPSLPALPTSPSLPGLPGLPSLPGLPGASSLPSSPGTPAA